MSKPPLEKLKEELKYGNVTHETVVAAINVSTDETKKLLKGHDMYKKYYDEGTGSTWLSIAKHFIDDENASGSAMTFMRNELLSRDTGWCERMQRVTMALEELIVPTKDAWLTNLQKTMQLRHVSLALLLAVVGMGQIKIYDELRHIFQTFFGTLYAKLDIPSQFMLGSTQISQGLEGFRNRANAAIKSVIQKTPMAVKRTLVVRMVQLGWRIPKDFVSDKTQEETTAWLSEDIHLQVDHLNPLITAVSDGVLFEDSFDSAACAIEIMVNVVKSKQMSLLISCKENLSAIVKSVSAERIETFRSRFKSALAFGGEEPTLDDIDAWIVYVLHDCGITNVGFLTEKQMQTFFKRYGDKYDTDVFFGMQYMKGGQLISSRELFELGSEGSSVTVLVPSGSTPTMTINIQDLMKYLQQQQQK